jgi:Integrase core domain
LSKLAVWWLRLGIGVERIKPGHPQQNGRHERMHLTLKKEATKPAAANFLQQQARFDKFIDVYNTERPHEIEKMSNRGRRAGLEILSKFNWENHAWIRYRSTMCCYQNSFERFANSYCNPLPQDRSVWLALKAGGCAPSYPWKGRQAQWAPESTAEFVGRILKWIETGECFCDGAPKPRPELRISPKV